jgi:cell division protease FtsH
MPLLVVGFFIWQGAFSTAALNTGNNTASTRMTYGRFVDYLGQNRIVSVDFYENGRTAIVEATDPELDGRVQRLAERRIDTDRRDGDQCHDDEVFGHALPACPA